MELEAGFGEVPESREPAAPSEQRLDPLCLRWIEVGKVHLEDPVDLVEQGSQPSEVESITEILDEIFIEMGLQFPACLFRRSVGLFEGIDFGTEEGAAARDRGRQHNAFETSAA